MKRQPGVHSLERSRAQPTATEKRCLLGVGDSLRRHLMADKMNRAEQIVNNIPGTNLEEGKKSFF